MNVSGIVHHAGLAMTLLTMSAARLSGQTDIAAHLTSENGKTFLALDQYIAACRQADINVVSIPPGTYYLKDSVAINDAQGLTLQGLGETPEDVRLVFTTLANFAQCETRPWYVFALRRCNQLRLRNFSVDFDPLPFTQGTIIGKTDDGQRWTGFSATGPREGKTLTFKVHAGYPGARAYLEKQRSVAHSQATVFVYDAETRHLKFKNWFGTFEMLDEDTVRLSRFTLDTPDFKEGDYALICLRPSGAFRSDFCRDTTFEKITIFSAPGVAYGTFVCAGRFNYRDLRITLGPRPVGATQDRLATVTADGVMHRFCQFGPIIENCDFGHMLDDGINLSGMNYPVIEVSSPRSFVLANPSGIGLEFHSEILDADSRVRIARQQNYELAYEGLVTAIKQVERPPEAVPEFIRRSRQIPAGATIRFYEIQTGHDLADRIVPGDCAMFPFANSRGFVIRNCYIHDNEPRGLLIQTEDGIIEHNRFERNNCVAIAIWHPGISHEAGYVSNLIVRHNVMRDTGLAPRATHDQGFSAGAIIVSGMPLPTHRHLQFLDNVIDGSSGAAFSLTGIHGLVLRGNTIRRANRREMAGVPNHAICIRHCRDVTIEGNTFTDPGEHGAGDVWRDNSSPPPEPPSPSS